MDVSLIKQIIEDLAKAQRKVERALGGGNDRNNAEQEGLVSVSDTLGEVILALGQVAGTNEQHAALDILLTELASHFDYDASIQLDPSLFLAYDNLTVVFGDESDEEGVALAKSLLPADFVLQSNV